MLGSSRAQHDAARREQLKDHAAAKHAPAPAPTPTPTGWAAPAPRARTHTVDMPAAQRALHYATCAGRDADPNSPQHHRYRRNPFAEADLGALVTGSLTLRDVLRSLGAAAPGVPELGEWHAKLVADGGAGHTAPSLVATALAAIASTAPPAAEDFSLYTGAAGHALALFRLHAADPGASIPPPISRTPLQLAADMSRAAAEAAVHESTLLPADSAAARHAKRTVSLALGAPGACATAAAVLAHAGDVEEARRYAAKAVEHIRLHAVSHAGVASEVLYGRAGAVHVLRWIGKMRLGAGGAEGSAAAQQEGDGGADPARAARQLLPAVVEAIVEDGRRTARALGADGDTPLLWQWHDKVYLGAAHGAAGILAVLLSVAAEAPEVVAPFLGEILAAVDFLADFDGYPVKLLVEKTTTERERRGVEAQEMEAHPAPTTMQPVYGTRGAHDDEVVVQWCHGAVGYGFMYLSAWRALTTAPVSAFESLDPSRLESGDGGQQHTLALAAAQYLHRALACGELTWRRGLVRKHFGVCHGLAGNAQLFVALWSATGLQVWYQRALAFAGIAAHWHGGHADNAFSLGEGAGGLAWLLADLLDVERWIRAHGGGGEGGAGVPAAVPEDVAGEASGHGGGATRTEAAALARPWLGFPLLDATVVCSDHGVVGGDARRGRLSRQSSMDVDAMVELGEAARAQQAALGEGAGR